MCPQFPADFSLGRTKFGYYITEALGSYFREIFLDDVKNSSMYTCCFDETINDEGWKELQVTLRFWSSSRTGNEVSFHHQESFFIGRATGEVLKEHILLALKNADILSKMLMLSRDGPNVNKKVQRLLSKEVDDDCGAPFLDIGSCNLHVVHNAFLAGLEQCGERVAEQVIDFYSFFDIWSARWEEYQQIQEKAGVPGHRFLKHVKSRWLTLFYSAGRLQEQLPALKEYFLKVIPNSGTKSSKALMQLKIVRENSQGSP